MTEGLVTRFYRLFGVISLLLALLSTSASGRPSARGVSVTIIGVTEHAVQVLGEDGRAETLGIGPASAFLRRGLLVRALEFQPGEIATLRPHRGPGGAIQVGLLCDPDSAMALEKYRGRPLSGTLLSLSPLVWVIQPGDSADGVPISLLVSARAVFSAGGTATAASAFEPGAAVTVSTRGLPSGLLSLVSATGDLSPGSPPPTPRSGFASGLVTELQTSALTLVDASGVTHTIAVSGATRVKVRRQAASLSDIATGMHVSAWLGSKTDGAGNPIATTVSASDPAHKSGKKSR